ncbi:hypothetical protein [Nocardioides mangrovi]|uniref:VOC domain-containing protein n=1 Tax=Nocardioides mangrovi TaxID=2874580 RepID=A0ABS7U6P2_9ACTN|nr:hypothetical protein [Nocardioides mangrovi]MBZ5736560.1 hypothetical protein [Nocardioides mangrovi]
MTIPPLTVRPVVHTAHLPVWMATLQALGAATISDDPMWTELQLGRGRVTLTELNRDAVEGEVSLGFETPDLAAYAARVRPPAGMVLEPFRTEGFESLRVVGRDGLEFLIDQTLGGGGNSVGSPAVSVHAMWITPDVERAAEDLKALGLRRRLSQGSGRVVDMQAGEGDVLVHISDGGPVDVDLALDVLDIESAHHALLNAQITHDVIDETHVARSSCRCRVSGVSGSCRRTPIPWARSCTDRLAVMEASKDDRNRGVMAGECDCVSRS